MSVAEVRTLQAAIGEVYVDRIVERWVVDLVRATRDLDLVAIGASVRGSLALERAVRAWALLSGRDYATPDDVELLFLPVLGHRIVFTPSVLADARRLGWSTVLERFRADCLRLAPPPALVWDGRAPGGVRMSRPGA